MFLMMIDVFRYKCEACLEKAKETKPVNKYTVDGKTRKSVFVCVCVCVCVCACVRG